VVRSKLHPELMMNGTQVMAAIQTIVWQYVLAIWKLRNEHLHHHADQMDLPNYRHAVTTLYEQHHLLTPAAQQALYRQPLATMLELPAPRLQTWTARGYDYFHRQLKAAKKTSHPPYSGHPDLLPPTSSAHKRPPTPIRNPVTPNQCGSSLYALVIREITL